MTDVRSGFWLRTVRALACALLVAAVGAPAAAGAGASRPDQLDDYGEQKARLFWLNDAGADVDNSQTLVRLLLYSNEIDIEGIVSTTSQFRRTLDEQSSKMPQRIFNAYGQVHSNLVKHDPQYPTALSHVRATRTPAQLEAFVSKLRAYSIFDQDDSGAWIRKDFPDLSYVASYGTWTGMGGGLGGLMASHGQALSRGVGIGSECGGPFVVTSRVHCDELSLGTDDERLQAHASVGGCGGFEVVDGEIELPRDGCEEPEDTVGGSL